MRLPICLHPNISRYITYNVIDMNAILEEIDISKKKRGFASDFIVTYSEVTEAGYCLKHRPITETTVEVVCPLIVSRSPQRPIC